MERGSGGEGNGLSRGLSPTGDDGLAPNGDEDEVDIGLEGGDLVDGGDGSGVHVVEREGSRVGAR